MNSRLACYRDSRIGEPLKRLGRYDFAMILERS